MTDARRRLDYRYRAKSISGFAVPGCSRDLNEG
jgi:hypothetical protein